MPILTLGFGLGLSLSPKPTPTSAPQVLSTPSPSSSLSSPPSSCPADFGAVLELYSLISMGIEKYWH